MADILEFPTREKQAFSFLQEQLSQLLRSKGADQTLIDFGATPEMFEIRINDRAEMTELYANIGITKAGVQYTLDTVVTELT